MVVLAGLSGVGGCDRPRPPGTALVDLAVPPLEVAASPDPSAPAGHVRFGHPLPVVGQAFRVRVEARSLSAEQLSTYVSEYRVEILAVEGPAPSRVSLAVLRNRHTLLGQETPTSIEGRAYVVDARAPHVRVDGAAAEEEQAQRVLDLFPDLGTRARLDEVLPDDFMRLGERRDEVAAAVLRTVHPRAWTLRAGTATLRRVEGEHAVFALALDAESASGLRMQVEGEARVRTASARLDELSLTGGYDGPSRDGGAGRFTLQRSVTTEPLPAQTSEGTAR
jgi:hypothetical protein